MSMVDEAVDHRGSHLVVREDAAPLRELLVRRQDQALALIAVRDDPKEQLGAVPLHGDIAPFIQDQ